MSSAADRLRSALAGARKDRSQDRQIDALREALAHQDDLNREQAAEIAALTARLQELETFREKLADAAAPPE